MSDYLLYAAYAVAGAIIGAISLPWKKDFAPNESTVMYIVGWAMLWPFLILWLAKDAYLYFTRTWSEYRAEQRYLKQKSQDQ